MLAVGCGHHLVAYEGDSAIYEAILAPLCDAPHIPFCSTNGAHSHSLVDDHAPLWKVAKCFRISK